MQRLRAWVAVAACAVFSFNAPLAAQEVLELRPVERGYQFRTKQHIPPTGVNRFGLQDPYPQFDASRFDGIAGFSRNHDGRAYQVHVYRTGLFFDLTGIPSCRIPDDCIDPKRYPLFIARAVLQELIESSQSTSGAKPC